MYIMSLDPVWLLSLVEYCQGTMGGIARLLGPPQMCRREKIFRRALNSIDDPLPTFKYA